MPCCPNPKSAHGRRAFTLIELLVVIAIIAILAAILFPVFAQAKAAAKKSVCLSATKQLGTAAIMYAGDYDDTLPVSEDMQWVTKLEIFSWFTYMWYDDGGQVHYDINGGTLHPYLKNLQVQSCPVGVTQLSTVLPKELPSGLGFNTGVMPAQFVLFGQPWIPVVNFSQIDTSAETVLVSDGAVVAGDHLSVATYVGGPKSGMTTAETWGVHNKQTNVEWCDGHAKSMTVTLRPDSMVSNMTTLATYKKYWVGDLINPKYPFGSDWDKYYYSPSKPQ